MILQRLRFLMTARVIENLNRCKIIARYGIGVDNVDLAAASKARILVTNVPDYCVDEVSDHALTLLLALARQIVTADRAVKAGAWDVVAHAGIRRLRGQTLGLLGFGKIAKALASKVQPLGMKVIVYDPYLEPAAIAPHGAEAVNFERLLAEADAISIHVPLQAPNIILTPHLAFYSRESVIELQTKAAEEVARALKGEPPRSPSTQKFSTDEVD